MTQLRAETPTYLGDPAEFLGFAFPTSELIDAAASMFPRPYRTQARWGSTGPRSWSERAELAPGSWPRLTIGPGLLAMQRHDLSADERSHERQRQNREKAFQRRQAEHRRATYGPMAFALTPAEIAGLDQPADSAGQTRGEIVRWSARSRGRLVRKILSLDLAALIDGDRLPVLVTLTLPGRWLEVTPTAEHAAAAMARFKLAWFRRWGIAPAWIWKREFQRRGAPHWHLWLVPPTGDLTEFRRWLAFAWTNALQVRDAEEAKLSRLRGTHVSEADGMRARDPKRLAVYFLKESLGGEGKAYQNDSPAEWAGQSVGRFWGTVGMQEITRTIDLDPELADDVWRILRHVRESSAGVRTVLVQRVNQRTGVVRTRSVRRRVKVRAAAGWIAVNDGAVTASQLARWLTANRPQ